MSLNREPEQFSGESETLKRKGSFSRPESKEEEKEIHIGKKTLVLIAGLPGSGKSTFAMRHFPLDSIISTDRIRQEISNNPANQLVSDKAFFLAKRMAEERLERGEIAVIDAQNLAEETRAQFYQAAEAHGARVEAILLDVDYREATARNKKRKKDVGEEYIRARRGTQRVALKSLEKSGHVNAVHVLKADETDGVRVALPEDDAEALKRDRDFLQEALRAEAVLGVAETGFLKREGMEDALSMRISAGSVMFLEANRTPEVEEFLKNNFFDHQVIDAERVAKRIHTEVGDEAVYDVMKFILKERVGLNLTTVVAYPPGFPYEERFRKGIENISERSVVAVPTTKIFAPDNSSVGQYRVEVERDAPEDVPLFLVGDVQGCYTAMRELSGRVREENLSNTEEGKPERTIVFVGDMADRGPYDAESVIYITSPGRKGRRGFVKGNHDENLLGGLKGEETKSQETTATVKELKRRLKPESIQKIIEMLEHAPYIAEWKGLVVAHAALPRIPRKGESLSEAEKKVITHGARTGGFSGGRAAVWKLHNTAAHDPEVLVVGGHTHEEAPVKNMIAGTAILDAGAEVQGKLWGMYYPELELASAEEPSVLKMFKILKQERLPERKDLLTFMEFARQQSFIDVLPGKGTYEGLTIASFSQITELGNLWEKYPVLRNFRGIIVDSNGNFVAHPFEKTHKAGDEIPLEKLNIVPEKVFEKANGSMGIVYFWKGKWNVSTKFSFENEDYTKPTQEMLSKLNTSVLDTSKTHVFEIILPNDSHIVDYCGKRELILLNSIEAKTGKAADWDDVVKTAHGLGVRTARDMTEEFSGKTIAEIYEFAQKEGNLANIEGLMARFRDAGGKEVMVKIKTREYDDKKFVRDRLDWKDILEAFEPATMEISEAKKDKLLGYNFDNSFAHACLETRVAWVKEQYLHVVADAREFLFAPKSEAELVYEEMIAGGVEKQKAVEKALRAAVPHLVKLLKEHKGEVLQGDMNAFMGFLRGIISQGEHPEEVLAKYAILRIQATIQSETKKRGKNSFWVIPESEKELKNFFRV